MKYIKTFENNENNEKIYIGSYIFEVEEDGVGLDEFKEYEDFDDYFINVYKNWITNIHDIAKDLSYPYYKDLKKDDFMKNMSDYADIVKLYKKIINKTISEIENMPEIKNYIKNKTAKKFKI